MGDIMLRKLLIRLCRKLVLEDIKQSYEAGVSTGYYLGYRLGQVEKSNRGFIFGSKMDQEIEEILKEKGG